MREAPVSFYHGIEQGDGVNCIGLRYLAASHLLNVYMLLEAWLARLFLVTASLAAHLRRIEIIESATFASRY